MRAMPMLWVPVLLLGACSEGGGKQTPASAAVAQEPISAPVDATPAATGVARTLLPAPGTLGFAGFGPARFGASAEQVRMAWGSELTGAPGEPGGCYYLQPVPPDGAAIGFMIEGDRFVRVDVGAADVPAPDGGAVGMTRDEIRRRYPGLQERPSKYDEEGRDLRVQKGDGVLLFETDGSGRVTGWRIGVVPQVDYVEGCG